MNVSDGRPKNRILIVDDEPGNIRVLFDILRQHYEVSAATTGEQALLVAREQSPDIILLDMVMPGLSGCDVCETLKADDITKDIPVIFVTSEIDVENEELGLRVGAVDYIRKPVSPPIVRARVKIHLQNYLTVQFLDSLLSKQTTTIDEARDQAKSLLVFV